MLLKELMRADYATSSTKANYATNKLMSQIEFVTDGNETSLLSYSQIWCTEIQAASCF
jgi:hypothetical protein